MERIMPGTGGNVYTPYEERIGNESIVYFTRDLSPEGLQKVYEKINGSIGGKVAVKLHTGEKNGPNIIPRDWVKALLDPKGNIFAWHDLEDYDMKKEVRELEKLYLKDAGQPSISS